MSAIAGLGLAVCAMAGCGGGGGGDPAVDAPPPAGGGKGVNPGLTGSFFMAPVASQEILRVDAATGASTPLVTAATNKHKLYVSPDGSRYAQVLHDSVTGQENSEFMVLEVYETATKKKLLEIEFDGYADSFRFSPDSRFLAAVRYPDRLADINLLESGLAILDLADPANPKTVVNFSRTGQDVVYDYDWLPNGQFVYLRGDLGIVTGSALVAGGAETVKGKVQAPAGFFVARAINASPDGTQLLFNFTWEDGTSKSDIWVGAADGSGVQRFSTNNYGQGASWSPDGQYIVATTDAGFASQAGASTAYCKRWYAPATARNVSELTDGTRLVQYLENGKAAEMPCRAGAAYPN